MMSPRGTLARKEGSGYREHRVSGGCVEGEKLK